MPKLKRLSGLAIIKILQSFGFEILRQKGSHVVLRRVEDEQKQTITVPVHGKSNIKAGTVKGIYNQAVQYISEDDLYPHFYTD